MSQTLSFMIMKIIHNLMFKILYLYPLESKLQKDKNLATVVNIIILVF